MVMNTGQTLLPEEMRHTLSVGLFKRISGKAGRAGQADISGKNLPRSQDIFQ